MPTYGKDNFKESNVNYLNKDFTSLKTSLMNYAKSYFPNTYRDFNETSPGMMLLEMNAYVGDTLSFYIDQQYREMLLPLAEERRNIINMAKMFGYKVKPIIPAYVDLTFKSEVNSVSGDVSKVDYSDAGVFDTGIEIPSSINSNIIFSTLDPIDFTITGSNDTSIVSSTGTNGLATGYTLSRTVRAVSAKQKIKTFKIGTPEKFKRITISDKNVVDIVSIVDSNGNNWYETDFLAQDKVPIPTHWTAETRRNSAYQNLETQEIEDIAVPYSLQYIISPKRFTRETNTDNTTSLVFGNGILRNGIDGTIDQGYIDMEQVGITIPGQSQDLNSAIDPLLGDEYSTLGETPNNTTLTVTYRIGGGINSNAPSGVISTTPTSTAIGGNTSATITSVTNEKPARGGKDQEDTLEIKEKAKAFFATQNRAVTKEDYEARVMNVPAKYGNIAKVYVTRGGGQVTTPETLESFRLLLRDLLTYSENTKDDIQAVVDTLAQAYENYIAEGSSDNFNALFSAVGSSITELQGNIIEGSLVDLENTTNEISTYTEIPQYSLSSVDIYVLAYNNQKHLVGNPHTLTTGTTDNLPKTLTSNISNYLENFKLLTDTAIINDGYIVNFGVFFDVIAEKYADKQQVKFKCIDVIKEYFRIEKMQFNQPIYKGQLEYELMGVEGIRSVGHVTITQKEDYFLEGSGDASPLGDGELLPSSTYSYSYDQVSRTYLLYGTSGYGYKYDFQNALNTDGTIIRPPLVDTPAVFELKNPNTNIQGRVR